MCKKLLIVCAVWMSSGILAAQHSYAKDYPTKAIEILVTYGPGGTSDLIARQIAEIAKKYLGQALFVSNRPGAGGNHSGF